MTIEELLARIETREDVEEPEVRHLVESPDANVRLLARTALAQSGIRRALEYCGSLAHEQNYRDQATLTAIQRLSTISDIDAPYTETLKRLGIQAADAGQCNAAMQYLQEAVFRGFTAGQRRDARSRKSMRYAHDIEIDEAIDRLARTFTPPAMRMQPSKPARMVALCTALADEDGPTVMTVKRVEHFRDEGFDVEVVSTETGSSRNSKMAARVAAMGVQFTPVPPGTWEERIRWLIAYFSDRPADVVVYMTSAQDGLAKLAACIGLAPVQSWEVRALEPQAGKFDLISHGISVEQEVHTRWPGIARYTGPGCAMAEEVDAALPFERSELGFPSGDVILATFGRVEKANTSVYLTATARILREAPHARLLFAGPDSMNAFPAMLEHYAQNGVAERVHYLGKRQADGPRLIKTIDIYCDTYPWPGGQTLLDAMQAGRPIVAMKRLEDASLDPTGTGATSSVADVFLNGLVPLAAAGDPQEYAGIALAYVRDPQLRARDGEILTLKVRRDCNLRTSSARYAGLLREIIETKAAQSISRTSTVNS